MLCDSFSNLGHHPQYLTPVGAQFIILVTALHWIRRGCPFLNAIRISFRKEGGS